MRRRIVLLLAVALVVVLQVPAAHAKGPAGGFIEGTGVDGVINVAQPGEPGQGAPMSRLVEVIGFFDLTFGESKAVLAEQPTKVLGDSIITITWDMLERSSITQHIYLDAEGGPVTHIAPGQAFWDDWETVGGWMVVTGDLATPLIELGVDESVFPAKTAAPAKKNPVTKTEPVKDGAVKTDAVKTEPTVKAPVETTPTTVAAPAAPSTSSPAAPSSGLGAGALLVVGLLLAAALGAGVWSRLRHPVPR